MDTSVAMEGRLRKLHRRDWPSFLNRVIPAHVWRDFSGSIEQSPDHRCRWSAKYVILCWVIMGWSIQGQLIERFYEGYSILSGLFNARRRPGGSYQGLVKATERVGRGVIHRFWTSLRPTIRQRLGRSWRWYHWIVMAVDGSRVDAPRTRRNERGLGIAGREKTHPQWWITWLVHMPSNILWDWRQGPGASSERSHLREMIGDLPPHTLLLGDIGFGGFDLLWTLQYAKVDFIIRCGGSITLLVDRTVQKIVRQGECSGVYLWPRNRQSRKPLCLRLVVLKRHGKRVYLLTNVRDSTRLSRRMMGELYTARWGIEVDYRGLKQTLGRRKLLAKTPEAGAMELAGNILALALLMLHAAVALAARVVTVSVSNALKVIRRAIAALIYRRPFTQFLKQLRAAVRDTYQRKRSKRAREWPHKKKEQPPGPPNFRRLSAREKAKINILWGQSAASG